MRPERNARPPSWLGRILIAIGISGAAFAALCCFAPFLVAGLVIVAVVGADAGARETCEAVAADLARRGMRSRCIHPGAVDRV